MKIICIEFCILPTHPPPINSDYLPAHIRTRPTAQPHHHALEVVRRTPPSSRYPAQYTLCALLVCNQCLCEVSMYFPFLSFCGRWEWGEGTYLIHIRSNIPRRNSINIYPLARPLITQRLGQLSHTPFTRRISRHRNTSLECQERSYIDYTASSSHWQVRILR